MVPSVLNGMRRNPYVLVTSLHDFPKLQGSSLILSVEVIFHLDTIILRLHQMKQNHCQSYLQSEINVLNRRELNYFQVMFRARSSNCDFP